MKKVKVAGYAKPAKLWEDCKEEAICYYERYYTEVFRDSEIFKLVGVYVDMTGNSDIECF